MNALQEIKNLPFSKAEQENYASQAIAEILSGNIDPLEADMRLKALEEVIKKIRTDLGVKDYVIEEALKYGKTFDRHGAKITVTTRTTKDYSEDHIWEDLNREVKTWEAMRKAREAVIDCGFDPSTGEQIAPPKTSVTTFLTYKF